MSALLPDSTIEVAARAIEPVAGCLVCRCSFPATDGNCLCADVARACITAALPDLIEICAKVADRRRQLALEHAKQTERDTARVGWIAEACGCEDCATAIRSLLTTREDKETK